MGEILNITKGEGDKMIVEVEMNYKDYLLLKGKMKDVHVFAEDAIDINSNFSRRGTDNKSKYLLVNRALRDGLTFKEKVKCQRLYLNGKIFFIYSVEREE